MTRELGHAALPIVPTFDDFPRQLEVGTSKALLAAGVRGGTQYGDAAGRSAGSRFGRAFANTAKAGMVGLFGAGVAAFQLGKDAIGLSSDQAESINAVRVSYDEQAKAVRKLGRDAAESLGLSKTEFNAYAVQFDAFTTKIAGGDGPKVVSVLDDLTTRGADFASVMNLEVNEALGLFQSGLAGESEPLRKFGIDLSAAAVESMGLKMGLTGTNNEFTEGEKVQARYALLMRESAKVSGDFANTSDGLANRQRILNARWDDARAKLGKALLPMMEDVAGFLLDKGLPAFERASDWVVDKGIPAFQDWAEEMRPLAEEILPAAGDALGIVRDFAKDAAPYAKDLVGAFNDMPDWAKTVLVGGTVAGLGAKKLGILGGRDSLIGGMVSKATPVPVIVMNPGFDTGLPGGGKTPPVVPLGTAAKTAATLPKWLPWVPVGLDSAPGQDSLMRQVTGVGPTSSDGLKALPMPNRGESGWGGYFGDMEPALREALDKVSIAFKRADLPSELKTRIALTGGPESMREAKALVAQYDLTPREKKTLFSLLGTERAQGQLRGTKSMMDQIRDKTVTVTVHTVRTSSDGVGFASGAGSSSAAGGQVRERIIERPTDLYVDGEKLGGFVDRRADRRISDSRDDDRIVRGR